MSDPNSPTAPEDNPYPPAPPAYQPPAEGAQNPGGYPAPAYTQPQYPQDPYGQPAYGAAPTYGGYPAPAKTNTLAIVSLISSLVGIFIVPFIGSIVGVITGHMSLSQIKRNGEQGRGLGLAGTIIGWVGIALGIILLIIIIALIGYAAANPSYRYSS